MCALHYVDHHTLEYNTEVVFLMARVCKQTTRGGGASNQVGGRSELELGVDVLEDPGGPSVPGHPVVVHHEQAYLAGFLYLETGGFVTC